MIDWTKPLRTVGGHRKVSAMSPTMHTPNDGEQTLALIVSKASPNCEWPAQYWTDTGLPADARSPALENVPEKRVVWVNVYPGNISGGVHRTRAKADGMRQGREACIRVEYEPGQFDEEPPT